MSFIKHPVGGAVWMDLAIRMMLIFGYILDAWIIALDLFFPILVKNLVR